jgi:hypothetical protein
MLAIAAGFLERMTNPHYGIEVNEEYSFRLHEALTEDPEFARSFATLALDRDDVETLPVCAWPWYLEWRENNGSPPAADFLDALFEYTDDPAVRLSVVRSAVFRDYPASAPGQEPSARSGGDGEEFSGDGQPGEPGPGPGDGERRIGSGDVLPDRAIGGQERPRPVQSPWLRARTARLADAGDRGWADASEIATYLLQLGDPESIDSLRALIDQRWPGREDLIATIQRHLAEANLDPLRERNWRQDLGIIAPGEQA